MRTKAPFVGYIQFGCPHYFDGKCFSVPHHLAQSSLGDVYTIPSFTILCFAPQWGCISLFHPVPSRHRVLCRRNCGMPKLCPSSHAELDFACSRSPTARDRQRTTTQPCTSWKRKCTIMWKRVTQAVRPAERLSFIPPGFILVARSPKKTQERRVHREVEHQRRVLSLKTRWQRLKNRFV
jgi:hypothetical protein